MNASKWIQGEIIEKIMQKWMKMTKSKKTPKTHQPFIFRFLWKIQTWIIHPCRSLRNKPFFNSCSGSGEEDWERTLSICFLSSLIKIPSVVSEKKSKIWKVNGRIGSDDKSSPEPKAKNLYGGHFIAAAIFWPSPLSIHACYS